MKNLDMTQGRIAKQIILYAIPLLLGNILQQLYNAFDAIVVGNYVSNEALAAVGASGPLINMIIAFFIGMSMGASVLISQFFGAKDDKGMHDTVHTAMLLAVIFGVVLSVVGVLASETLLRWMATPPEIMADALTYLRIFFFGMTGLTVYNMGAAVLTAIGDSRRPLYFLALSAFLNITGNLLFVNVFHMGIAGVAYSTIIAEAISAIFVVMTLCRAEGSHRLNLRDLKINAPIVKRIATIGLPGGIQQAIISCSNIMVQAYINKLGAPIVAGYSAGAKVDAFIMLPTMTMALAVTTFVGQNLGAKNVQRARQGVRVSLGLGLGITIAFSLLVLLFRTPLLRIFSPDQEILSYGAQFMGVFIPGYFLLCFTQIIPGALRGAGDVNFATVTCIVSFVVLRQIYLFVITQFSHTITSVALGYPLTWLIAAVAMILYYRKSDWRRFEAAA